MLFEIREGNRVMDREQISRLCVIILSSIYLASSNGVICVYLSANARRTLRSWFYVRLTLGRLYLIRNAGTRLKNREHPHAFHKRQVGAARGEERTRRKRRRRGVTRGSGVLSAPTASNGRERAQPFSMIFSIGRPVHTECQKRKDEKDLSPHPI